MTRKNVLRFMFAASLLVLSAAVHGQPPAVTAYVDLNKYSGLWYEIAAIPTRFEYGCHCTTAEYTLSDKGYVIVENRCRRGSVDGEQSYIRGKAFAKKNSSEGKLKVQFRWPFRSKYWIVDLANDYSYSVVSNPSRKYLWILSRTPKMDENLYNDIITRLKERGFDLSRLRKTEQCV